MTACLREAIHVCRTQAKGWRHFNVLYGTDSKSCAHELEENWQRGDLGAVAKSAIASLVETCLLLRRELHELGGTFATVKLPGHGGVYPMAAADACAKACHGLHAKDVQLRIRSTLVVPHATPNNPATLATGADRQKWQRWEGRPSAHAASSRHLRFARGRLQEMGCMRLLERYRAQHAGEARYLAIDWVQAGLQPPERQYMCDGWRCLPTSMRAGPCTALRMARPMLPRSPRRQREALRSARVETSAAMGTRTG